MAKSARIEIASSSHRGRIARLTPALSIGTPDYCSISGPVHVPTSMTQSARSVPIGFCIRHCQPCTPRPLVANEHQNSAPLWRPHNQSTMRPEYPTRTLGRHGPTVSAIGFGAMGMWLQTSSYVYYSLIVCCRYRGVLRTER